ncbi:transmembrane receptor [Brachionus plicatilis]|uniref:Transmembrane receptor n=1 Tax=Brachionus plicatilis TaxID=10195 RepID=A0A3M7RA80_BRAPC|nr:transmembrane receptor [Brachionus plicatilis]
MVLYEDAYYIGCFNDHFLNFPQLQLKSSGHFNFSNCLDTCRDKDFSFAGTVKINHIWNRCICENRYATRMNNQSFCECQCSGEESSFCGCPNNFRFYSLKNRSTSYELHLNYIGRELFRIKKQFSTNNKWDSSVLAAKKCIENKNFSFSSLIRKNDFYACPSEDDLIESIDIQNFKNITNDTKIDNDESEHEIGNIESLEECKKRNFTYSIIGQSGNFCTNKYGLYCRRNDNQCECMCSLANDENCGCGPFEMVYRLKGGSEFSTPSASFKGCFYTDSAFNSNYLGRNTLSLCLKYCIKKNAKFFAISNGFECFCENENNFGSQVDTRLCDIKCPGNASEICGGYFGLMSLYEITYASIVLTTSDKEIMINQSFELNFKFNEIPFEEIMYFTIEFGDGDTKIVIYSEIDSESFQEQNVVVIKRHNENSITQISIKKEYQDIGPHSIRVYNKEEKNILSIDILIKSNETMYRGFKPIFIFIFENGDYIGCYANIEYVRINYHLLVKNQEICAIECFNKGFIFSATQNMLERACLCRSSNPINQAVSSCYCACPYSNHRFCGCHYYTRLYKIQVNTTKTSMIGIYSGCFLINPSFKKDIEIGFLNNDVCIIYCNENNYSYAATKMGLKFI